MFLTVFAASFNAFFVASSQLFGELPISSIIFTTANLSTFQVAIFQDIFTLNRDLIPSFFPTIIRKPNHSQTVRTLVGLFFDAEFRFFMVIALTQKDRDKGADFPHFNVTSPFSQAVVSPTVTLNIRT